MAKRKAAGGDDMQKRMTRLRTIVSKQDIGKITYALAENGMMARAANAEPCGAQSPVHMEMLMRAAVTRGDVDVVKVVYGRGGRMTADVVKCALAAGNDAVVEYICGLPGVEATILAWVRRAPAGARYRKMISYLIRTGRLPEVLKYVDGHPANAGIFALDNASAQTLVDARDEYMDRLTDHARRLLLKLTLMTPAAATIFGDVRMAGMLEWGIQFAAMTDKHQNASGAVVLRVLRDGYPVRRALKETLPADGRERVGAFIVLLRRASEDDMVWLQGEMKEMEREYGGGPYGVARTIITLVRRARGMTTE